MAKKSKRFTVWAKLRIDCSIEISAGSLEEAIEKAKILKEKDFVAVLGDYHDGDGVVYGVMQEDVYGKA